MPTFLGIAGSLRRASTNRGLLRAAQAALPEGVSKVVQLGTDDKAQLHMRYAPFKVEIVDIGNLASVRDFAGRMNSSGRSIDILLNNAGITQPVKTLDITGADYDRILDVSLRGTLHASQAVLPTMVAQNSGSIVCISSVSAQRGGGILGGPHYSAAKAGVLGLARAMAREFGGHNIRVNCITPGLIATDINKGKIPEDKRQGILDGIPLARIGEPNDVAGCVVFLASDLSKYCTGITLDVNGGMLIH